MSIESELAKRDKLLAEKSARIRELEAQLEERTCNLGAEVSALDVTLNMLSDIPWYWCLSCGAATPSISNYCMHCGARVTPKNSETTPKAVV